jgi:predicted nucleotidyltransferase
MIGGLPIRTINATRRILQKYSGIEKAIIFGSRAKGSYREGSDIDLSLFTNNTFTNDDLHKLRLDFDDSSIPYLFDVNIYSYLTNTELKDHIMRVGKTLYEKSR